MRYSEGKMTWTAGIDEAGYGAILGPLTHGGVASENNCPWHLILTSLNCEVGDSKKLYRGGKGIGSIERTVLCASRLSGWKDNTLVSLLSFLNLSPQQGDVSSPLPHQTPLPLFSEEELPQLDAIPGFSMFCMATFPTEFNELLGSMNKSELAILKVFSIVKRLLRKLDEGGVVIIDKQGGRNFYSTALCQHLDTVLVSADSESKSESRYDVRGTEYIFRMKADSSSTHVALASMLAKYTRELFMHQFKQHWKSIAPEIEPTAGYPQDASRFLVDLAASGHIATPRPDFLRKK